MLNIVIADIFSITGLECSACVRLCIPSPAPQNIKKIITRNTKKTLRIYNFILEKVNQKF